MSAFISNNRALSCRVSNSVFNSAIREHVSASLTPSQQGHLIASLKKRRTAPQVAQVTKCVIVISTHINFMK